MELPDDLEGMSLLDLREALNSAGYSWLGEKSDLIQRIRSLSV